MSFEAARVLRGGATTASAAARVLRGGATTAPAAGKAVIACHKRHACHMSLVRTGRVRPALNSPADS